MVEKRRGLGRGLGALIPSAPVEEVIVPEVPSRRPGSRPADLFFEASQQGQDAKQRRTGDAGSGGDAPASSTRAKARPSSRTSVPSLRAGRASANSASSESVPKAGFFPETQRDTPGSTTERAPGKPTESPEAVDDSSPAPSESVPNGFDDFSSSGEASDGSAAGRSGEDASVSRETSSSASAETQVDSLPGLVDVPGARFAELPVDAIHANRKQPRQEFNQDELTELVHSIREVGVLQPIVVRPSSEGGAAGYELVMGERRWRATREAGLDTVPAIIRLTADDDLLRDALLENLHRSSLNPLEEAAAYQQLLDDFGCSHEELSGRIGRSRPQISNTLRLMKLPPLVQRRVAAGIISAGHARALLGLADQADMEKIAQRIVAEGLSVRSTEEIVSMSGGLRRPAKATSPHAGARHERLDYLATSLSDRLDTSVKITLGVRKGKVSIEFASVDDLNRIMTVLAPSEG
ncbi:ParB/RepB/Spo0J family partition protein [Arthrobacter sp. CAN_A214]|uniref:ParB/RepB/Spo0J family partition protein n=1 Tax=Arthrobacter sp. CAN_A214 TaxID=2787720 RepID=UPI0018CB4976